MYDGTVIFQWSSPRPASKRTSLVPRRYRVQILTQDSGLVQPEQAGLSVPLQAVRIAVTLSVLSRSHVVVSAAAAPWRLDDEQVIRALFPVDFVSCIQDEGPGRVALACASGSDAELEGAAAAVATLKRSWGWDESAHVVVQLVHTGHVLSVDPRLEKDAWTVQVTLNAPRGPTRGPG